jgi:hypothetical protein
MLGTFEMMKLPPAILAVLVVALAQPTLAQTPAPLPLKYVGPPTVPAITSGDLMTRLYKFADDSLMGRAAGTVYNLKATAYIEAEVRRLGLIPAGDSGGYYQDIGIMRPSMDLSSQMSIDGEPLEPGVEFLVNTSGPIRTISQAPVLIWHVFDSATAPTFAELAGKVVLLRQVPALAPAALTAWRRSPLAATYRAILDGSSGAVGVLVSAGDSIPFARMKEVTDTAGNSDAPSSSPLTIVVPRAILNRIFGSPWTAVPSGTVGKAITVNAKIRINRRPGRNVVAILRGSDPNLRGQYVALGAHNDHIGFSRGPRGLHDSLRIVNKYIRPAGSEGGRDLQTKPITDEEWAQINSAIADLRRVYPERADSIFNGADDDGSGTVSLLEIAEALARGSVKPKRSMLFVWHTGEEFGLWGSRYFMDHPTMPRDSIVALLNIDMIGRGDSSDMTGQTMAPEGKAVGDPLHGGARYLQVIGSRRLSTEFGDLVEQVNRRAQHRFVLDYRLDASGHQQQLYYRSDHWSYAKWGIPVAFFTTGGHADYHQPTDEPQYIRYDHMAAVSSLILDVALATANLDHRVVVDHGKSNTPTTASCRQ